MNPLINSLASKSPSHLISNRNINEVCQNLMQKWAKAREDFKGSPAQYYQELQFLSKQELFKNLSQIEGDRILAFLKNAPDFEVAKQKIGVQNYFNYMLNAWRLTWEREQLNFSDTTLSNAKSDEFLDHIKKLATDHPQLMSSYLEHGTAFITEGIDKKFDVEEGQLPSEAKNSKKSLNRDKTPTLMGIALLGLVGITSAMKGNVVPLPSNNAPPIAYGQCPVQPVSMANSSLTESTTGICLAPSIISHRNETGSASSLVPQLPQKRFKTSYYPISSPENFGVSHHYSNHIFEVHKHYPIREELYENENVSWSQTNCSVSIDNSNSKSHRYSINKFSQAAKILWPTIDSKDQVYNSPSASLRGGYEDTIDLSSSRGDVIIGREEEGVQQAQTVLSQVPNDETPISHQLEAASHERHADKDLAGFTPISTKPQHFDNSTCTVKSSFYASTGNPGVVINNTSSSAAINPNDDYIIEPSVSGASIDTVEADHVPENRDIEGQTIEPVGQQAQVTSSALSGVNTHWNPVDSQSADQTIVDDHRLDTHYSFEGEASRQEGKAHLASATTVLNHQRGQPLDVNALDNQNANGDLDAESPDSRITVNLDLEEWREFQRYRNSPPSSTYFDSPERRLLNGAYKAIESDDFENQFNTDSDDRSPKIHGRGKYYNPTVCENLEFANPINKIAQIWIKSALSLVPFAILRAAAMKKDKAWESIKLAWGNKTMANLKPIILDSLVDLIALIATSKFIGAISPGKMNPNAFDVGGHLAYGIPLTVATVAPLLKSESIKQKLIGVGFATAPVVLLTNSIFCGYHWRTESLLGAMIGLPLATLLWDKKLVHIRRDIEVLKDHQRHLANGENPIAPDVAISNALNAWQETMKKSEKMDDYCARAREEIERLKGMIAVLQVKVQAAKNAAREAKRSPTMIDVIEVKRAEQNIPALNIRSTQAKARLDEAVQNHSVQQARFNAQRELVIKLKAALNAGSEAKSSEAKASEVNESGSSEVESAADLLKRESEKMVELRDVMHAAFTEKDRLQKNWNDIQDELRAANAVVSHANTQIAEVKTPEVARSDDPERLISHYQELITGHQKKIDGLLKDRENPHQDSPRKALHKIFQAQHVEWMRLRRIQDSSEEAHRNSVTAIYERVNEIKNGSFIRRLLINSYDKSLLA